MIGWIYRHQFNGTYGHGSTSDAWKEYEEDEIIAERLRSGALLLLLYVYWDEFTVHLTTHKKVRGRSRTMKSALMIFWSVELLLYLSSPPPY